MALTNAQVMEHVGRMISRGLTQQIRQDVNVQILLSDLVVWSKDYRQNGVNQDERKEAMRAFMRELCLRLTGIDPAADAVSLHRYKNHFLEKHAPGEAGALEP